MKRRFLVICHRIRKDIKKYLVLAGLFLLYDIIVHLKFQAFCPVVILTGFPCPGCGMTRALFNIIMGNFQRAWLLHPVSYGWVALALWAIYCRYVCGKKVKGLKYVIAFLLIWMVILYAYRMLMYFPSYPPMTYTKNNIMWKYLPFYKQWIRSCHIA